MAVFWCNFRHFVGTQKIEDLTESKTFFAELFQITSRFVLSKKNFGVRCTLSMNMNEYECEYEYEYFIYPRILE